MNMPTTPRARHQALTPTNTVLSAMTNTLRTATARTRHLIGFTVLIERLAFVLGRPTRLA